MATFTLTFNATQGATLSVSGFTFTVTSTNTVYTCNTPPPSETTLNDEFTLGYSETLVSVENIPTTVTTIAGNAFNNCTYLTSIIIPATVTTIGNNAFQDCTSLTSVTLTYGLTTIFDYAFYNCGVTSITIPASITNFSNQAFSSCASLTSVTLESGLQIIGEGAFSNSGVTSVTIPASITNFGNQAFSSCASLTSVTLESGLQIIGEGAFSNCTSLSSITIPSSVTTFGTDAFTGIPTDPNPNPSNAATLFYDSIDVFNQFFNVYGFGNTINYDPPPTPPPIPMVCFKEDSKILTKQGYRPIQDLRKGDLIKTIKHGYVPIDMIGYREIYNPICEERIKDKLYVCTNKEYSEIFEDLVITGCHSILIEKYLTQEQLDKSSEVNGGIFATDDKYRLPACVDERAKPYEKEGIHTIYHLALENEDYFMNYGIYANGLIVETCSKRYLKELSNMTLINL